jgi:DNA topoisomerase-1
MSASNLVIVESPAKAKTINKYLGPDYTVVASFGHVRDLPAKNGSVDPEHGFAMQWEIGERSHKPLGEIVARAKTVDTIYLATDPDREGEAISWHIEEYLKEKKLTDKVVIKRVTFNEITKSAVQEAFKNARQIDNHLVEAYLARRALDYLVGFNLSPVLWRKLPGSRSAGRVQSVALRLICEREAEIEIFKPEEYWSIETLLTTKEGKSFTARLSQLDGKKIEKMTIKDKTDADTAVERIRSGEYAVSSIEKKQVRRHPYAPFITSTLQQEASRKLRFSATKTMRTAQKLYEGVEIGGETTGLITYMRTDGITLSGEAIAQARALIKNKFGENYLPDAPRAYKSKVKNAQEAHEAIRPTDIHRTPESVAQYLDEDELRLYELVWKRTVACQMESAVLDQVSVDIANKDGKVVLHATGSVVTFDGFLKVYREESEDEEKNADAPEEERRLPPLKEGEALSLGDVTPDQHFTQPPPRYTEASLVKKLEELGIGRPSTYASILQVLQEREYVKLDQRRFIPESRGRIVTAFLINFFKTYVEYNFTAGLEEQLDEISAGDIEWKKVLAEFWGAFSEAVAKTKDLTITEVITALDHDLERYLYADSKDRTCPQCKEGTLNLKLGKFGAFVGCTKYPECRYTRPVLAGGGGDNAENGAADFAPKVLGNDPGTGWPITLRRGPYGPYVQLGPNPNAAPPAPEPEPVIELDKKGKPKKPKKPKKAAAEKPKRAPVPRNMQPDDVDIKKALGLLSLPRDVGLHPETKEMIKAGIGRFGPFLVHQGKFKSIPADDPDGVLEIGLNRAVDLLAQQGKGRGGGFGTLKELGPHPADAKPVTVSKGRFGPYIKHGATNATLPKDITPETVTMEQAVALLEAKKSKPAKPGAKPRGKKAKEAT